MNDVAELPKPGWQAELDLRIGVRPQFGDGVSRLVARRHRGPLVIQRPFYPEGDPCHLYVVHPPGGVVGGDELRIRVEVERGAHAVITTPAATKFYRCDGRTSSQTQELSAAGATLEWLPQESIFYRGAETRTATRVHLDAESRFIGWEIACLGLPARGERFDVGALKLDLEVWRDTGTGTDFAKPKSEPVPATSAPELGTSAPLFIDRLRLTGSSPARGARWGLAGQDAVGTLLATPTSRGHLEEVRELVADLPLAAVSLVDGILVLRALAPQAEALRNLFVEAWKRLRPGVIGRVAVPPRIWST
ncbi:MAG: urease accessory protein UreD [Steroidobacteraceae bacterium]|nr:urease accessory protein UreD [Steroidobacteraceae bacterium]